MDLFSRLWVLVCLVGVGWDGALCVLVGWLGGVLFLVLFLLFVLVGFSIPAVFCWVCGFGSLYLVVFSCDFWFCVGLV